MSWDPPATRAFSQLDKAEFQRTDVNEGIRATIALVSSQVPDGVELDVDLDNRFIWFDTGELDELPGDLPDALPGLRDVRGMPVEIFVDRKTETTEVPPYKIRQGQRIAGVVVDRGGLDPTIVVGGRLRAFDSNARLGRGQYLVAEADESDGSFMHLTPTIAVVTNIDADHLDFYSGIVLRAIGIPTNMFTVMFAIGRLPGWMAQWKEMTEDPETRIDRVETVLATLAA